VRSRRGILICGFICEEIIIDNSLTVLECPWILEIFCQTNILIWIANLCIKLVAPYFSQWFSYESSKMLIEEFGFKSSNFIALIFYHPCWKGYLLLQLNFEYKWILRNFNFTVQELKTFALVNSIISKIKPNLQHWLINLNSFLTPCDLYL
jgi:hypothetical protein